MDAIRLNWGTPTIFTVDEFRIYRDTSPMDPNALPAPVATVAGTTFTYDDGDVVADVFYYYRIEASSKGVLSLSSEYVAKAGPSTIDVHDVFEDGSALATYKFDQSLADLGGGTSNTLNQNFTYGTGKFGDALESLGDDARIEYDLTQNGNPRTISFWLYLTSYRRSCIASFGRTSYGTWLQTDGNLLFNNVTYNAYTIGVIPPTNTWHHICITYDPSIPEGKYYVNGVLEQTITNPTTAGGNLILMGDSEGTYPNQSLPTGSKIDQFRAFNKALTDAEITELYNEV